jgi:hypothetical protein
MEQPGGVKKGDLGEELFLQVGYKLICCIDVFTGFSIPDGFQ